MREMPFPQAAGPGPPEDDRPEVAHQRLRLLVMVGRVVLLAAAAALVVSIGSGLWLYFFHEPSNPFDDVGSPGDGRGVAPTMQSTHTVASYAAAAAMVLWAGVMGGRRQLIGLGLGLGAIGAVLAAGLIGLYLPWDQLARLALGGGTSGYRSIFDDQSVRFVLVDGQEISTGTIRTLLAGHWLFAVLAAILLSWSGWAARILVQSRQNRP